MNVYLSRMKKALEAAHAAALQGEQKIDELQRTYRADFAAPEVEKVEASLDKAKASAKDEIIRIKDEGVIAAKRWGQLDGKAIDDADVKLLKYDLNADQLQQLIDKHRNNGTMCFILGEYVKKKREKDPEKDFFSAAGLPVSVPSAEEKEKALEWFASAAIGYIDSLYGNGWGKGANNEMLQSAVKRFAEPNPANYAFLEALGG